MRCILVAGIHHSGTSCVAGVLHHLGVFMGSNLRKPEGNKGFFEDCTFRDLVGIREPRIKRWLEGRLDEKKMLWGVKYNETLFDRKYAVIDQLQKEQIDTCFIIVRRPIEAIANSLGPSAETRGKIPAWKRYISLHTQELQQIGIPLLIIHYDRLIDFLAIEMKRLIEFCFEGMDKPAKSQVDMAFSFVDPNMRHWKNGN